MMQIYMVHPIHGKKIAIDLKEKENDMKAGWKEVTKAEFYPKPSAPVAVVSAQRDDLVAKYTEKHGKAPHHRMSDATIEAALND